MQERKLDNPNEPDSRGSYHRSSKPDSLNSAKKQPSDNSQREDDNFPNDTQRVAGKL